MGYGRALVGLRVDQDQLYENKEVPNCDHKHDSKFCPNCGKPAGTTTERVLKDFVELEYPGEDYPHKVAGYEVIHPVEDDRYYVILFRPEIGTDESLSDNLIPLHQSVDPAIQQDFEKFGLKMTELGLWNPELFGVWATYSY